MIECRVKVGESVGVELKVESLATDGIVMTMWLWSEATETPRDVANVGALLSMLILVSGGGSCEFVLCMLILLGVWL